jgi:hypothetical protein
MSTFPPDGLRPPDIKNLKFQRGPLRVYSLWRVEIDSGITNNLIVS